MSDLPNLPDSKSEFWEGYKSVNTDPKKMYLCETHTKDNWLLHDGYIDNYDGTISCMFCPWGTRLAGYYRVLDKKIVDLRTLNSSL